MSDIDASDPKLAQAWHEMSDNKSANNWLLLFVGADKKVSVTGTGTGGYKELIAAFDPALVQFGVLRVIGKDNRQTLEAMRTKFVFFTYIGDKVSVLNKARVSVQRPSVEKIFNGYATRIDVSSDLQTFTREAIAKELLKCGGAHTPSHYVYGPDDELAVASLS